MAPIALSKVLVANRGEIACRILRTCRKWGIPTVAVYSSADSANCLHARLADEAYCIGTGPTARESYLDLDSLLSIAQATGADAVHPGYGFLSERPEACEMFANAGVGGGGVHNIRWIGPPAEAIRAMGDKTASKVLMEQVGVPVVPGFHDDSMQAQDAQILYEHAVEKVGFPLLIKAVSGGGGKGMRLVTQAADFASALESCQREAQASFGDARVLLERYLVRPRHVEVQIVSDTHGNCVHLYERDCSLQRRHQKVLEEAPASDLPPSVRERLGEMAKLAANGVSYVNAGTVEFLLESDNPENFYFCEMNTRLQVEHPVTEMITGIDLVEWQLRVAAGEQLPCTQEEVPCHGHAFEARIYAENPANNFLPATGTLWHHETPALINDEASLSSKVRVDAGVEAGQEISVYYDPMISKLISHGETREAALQTLEEALRGYRIAGVPTNIDFLTRCVQHPIVRKAGAITTAFLEENEIATTAEVPPMANVVGTLLVLWKLENRNHRELQSSHRQPWSSDWGSQRLTGGTEMPVRHIETEDGSIAILARSNPDGSYMISAGDDEPSYHVAGGLRRFGDQEMIEVVLNHTQSLRIHAALREGEECFRVSVWPQNLPGCSSSQWNVNFRNPLRPRPVASKTCSTVTGGDVRAPMPGKITRVEKNVGDVVQKGDVVVVLEAMKMEHSCKSPIDGVVGEVRYQADDVVAEGVVLCVIADDGSSSDGGGEDAGNV